MPACLLVCCLIGGVIACAELRLAEPLLAEPGSVHAEPALAELPAGTTAEATAEPIAEVVAEAAVMTKVLSVSSSGGQKTASLLDGKTATKLSLPAASVLDISAPSGQVMAGLYLIWDRPPGPWILSWDGESGEDEEIRGNYGYLHEYVPLREGISSLNIRLTEGIGLLCDVYVFGPGLLPEWVQIWQPSYEEADLLLLPTHADDEHLFFGGTMPYYAGELGLRVQVAYLTNHWGEAYRTHELLNGLWTVGIEYYPVIGPYPDYPSRSLEHARSLYDTKEMVDYQIGLLRRFRPLVVIGHDIGGEYGHGVHMLNTDTLRLALEASSDPEAAPASAVLYGLWDVPKTYLHLYPENHVQMDWDRPLARFGGATAFEMAQEGFACHVSQQKWYSVRKTGVHDCRSFGLYRSYRGPDLNGGDFMEGLVPYSAERFSYEALVLPRFDLKRYGLAGIGNYFSLGSLREKAFWAYKAI